MGFSDRFDAFNEHVTLFLLRFVGPPTVSAPDSHGRDVSEDEREREAEIRGAFERMTRPDGSPYLLER
ncbi:hypothetical protein [Cellulomonas sp. URHE0023]|uniref:hypothetical protein n=1 Tax=Cellulomonas sp. URHE0023 TaxID=1380354 RepID=UPI000487C079|nr:hypothetical protein [Cellulomonas sp. URHE0023]